MNEGMLCPLDVMGQLVSLQGDISPDIRKDSLRLVQIEDERHPTFLDNRLLEGVEMSYLFQIKTIGDCHPVEDNLLLGLGVSQDSRIEGLGSAVDGDIFSIFGSLYTTCIQSNKKRRNDFLIGLLKRALQISQLLKIKNQSSGSSPRNLSEKISPYQSKKIKVKSVTENGDTDNNNNENIGIEGRKNNFLKKKDNKKNEDKENENNEMNVDEANHLYSLLSFILTTLTHLPFETIDEPLQVPYCTCYTVMYCVVRCFFIKY